MPKLPTTFTTLDLTGFDIDKTIKYSSINRDMVDKACAVLQKNRVRIVVRSVQAALKEIYGLGGSSENICRLLDEWRRDNLTALKDSRGEKNLISAILDDSDLLDETEIPEEVQQLSRQIGVILYTFAHQKADTAISGDRIKELVSQNELLKNQVVNFPQMEMELGFYKQQYERSQLELKEAYINLNKQKLVESEGVTEQITALQNNNRDLGIRNSELTKKLAELADSQSQINQHQGEIAKLNGALEAREREVFTMREQIQVFQSESGQKLVLESQLSTALNQLKESNDLVVRLQGQLQEKSISEIQVDVDVEALNNEISELTDERDLLRLRIEELENQSNRKKRPLAA
jgi:chromosome segregation ATPase